MTGTGRVFRAELARLACVRATWIVAVLLCGTSAARAWIGLGWSAAGLAGDDPVTSGAGWAPLVDGWRTGLTLGSAVLLAAAARGLAADREAGVLRLATTRSASRGAIVLGRLLLAPVLVPAVVVLTGAGALAVVLVADDGTLLGPLVEDGYELLLAAELRAELGSGLLAVLPPLLAVWALGLAVSALSRSPAVAVTAALALLLAFDLFKEELGDPAAWVFLTHVPTPWDSSAFHELSGFARGFADAGHAGGLARIGWLASAGALVACPAAAVVAMARRAL